MSDTHKPAAPKPAPKPQKQPVAARMPRKPREPAPEHPGPVAAFLGGVVGVALTVPFLAIKGARHGLRWARGRRWRR